MSNQAEHGCVGCYEINKGFHMLKINNKKQCDECGGTVLLLQELLDHIANLEADLRSMQEIYENKYDR